MASQRIDRVGDAVKKASEMVAVLPEWARPIPTRERVAVENVQVELHP